FIYITQLAVKQMQAQKTGGSIVSISAALVDNPIAGVTASLSMITKGGLNAVTRSLAMEYAKEHIRFNAVAPGVVDSPLHDKDSRIVRLGVSVATSGDVRDQPKVADAASELLQDVFGKEKNPCRLVYGVASLPLGTPVELEVIFEVAGSPNAS